jgi:hypothetical protein
MRHVPSLVLTSLFLSLILGGCSDAADAEADDSKALNGPNVVDVVARGFSLEALDTLPSGWTTFRFRNESPLAHFVAVELLPDGKLLEDIDRDVIPVFQDAMDLINEGRTSEGFAQFERFPAWYFDVVFMGGPGFLGPEMTGETTVFMAPGTYMLECYVKTAGRFHSVDGMAIQVTVTEEPSNAPEPSASMILTLANDGFTVEGEPTVGKNTVRVDFAEQMLHEHSLGHDVHLVRVTSETDLDAVAVWMNWMNPAGLESPAPAEFLGGTHEMPAGEVAYFTVDLVPGDYAWIAEVPDPQGKGMLMTFTVE